MQFSPEKLNLPQQNAFEQKKPDLLKIIDEIQKDSNRKFTEEEFVLIAYKEESLCDSILSNEGKFNHDQIKKSIETQIEKILTSASKEIAINDEDFWKQDDNEIIIKSIAAISNLDIDKNLLQNLLDTKGKKIDILRQNLQNGISQEDFDKFTQKIINDVTETIMRNSGRKNQKENQLGA